jgi:glycosyltransferase involved in cell wall biosynthesis
MLRIGLNSQKLLAANTGVGNYTYHLVRHLLEVDRENRYCLFFFNQLRDGQDLFARSVAPYQVESSGFGTTLNSARILWEQILLPARAKACDVDVFHYIDHTLSLVRRPCPTVITVHDLAFFRVPEMYNLSRRFYKQFVSLRSVKRATRVITISEYTRREILEITGVDGDRVEVIPYGISAAFRPIPRDAALEAFRARARLPERFLLFVGTLQPRKNVDGLLRAFRKALDRGGFPHSLVLAGDRGWLYEEVFALIGTLGLRDRVIYMDTVPHGDLPAVYNLADLFVYPSWFEGFGLPPLEAMACGTPVICSSTTSLPEVVGDAGITVHPSDVDGLADGIARVLSDPALAARMREAGLARARTFSWDENARRTIGVYRRVAGRA